VTEPLLTPYEVERRLLHLSQELDAATQDLVEAEAAFTTSKRVLEMALARARVDIARENSDARLTVQEKGDIALIKCEEQVLQADADEIWVRGTKAQVANLRTQVDIIRSIGTSVRSSMDIA
jgi:hypothetical protein